MITGLYLLVVFGLSILFILLSIIRFKLNPFLALILTTNLTCFHGNLCLVRHSCMYPRRFGWWLALRNFSWQIRKVLGL